MKNILGQMKGEFVDMKIEDHYMRGWQQEQEEDEKAGYKTDKQRAINALEALETAIDCDEMEDRMAAVADLIAELITNISGVLTTRADLLTPEGAPTREEKHEKDC